MTVEAERRCPSCGALVAADAEWCGQCFADLRPPRSTQPADPAPEASPTVADRRDVGAGASDAVDGAWWPCAACGARNPIELDTCARCGTPFADLMRDASGDRRVAEPKEALAWSLIFPGLGHRVAGRPLDGLARGVLFGMSFAMALLLGFAGVRSGPTFAVFAVFLLTALVVYGGSAYEAYRIADGADVFIGSRPLLWLLVGLILLSIVMLALAVASASGAGS